jgi:hypothetical protein
MFSLVIYGHILNITILLQVGYLVKIGLLDKHLWISVVENADDFSGWNKQSIINKIWNFYRNWDNI